MTKFSQENLRRSESPRGFGLAVNSWSLSDWLTATVGELGEAANIIKKLKRAEDGIPGNTEPLERLKEMLADELADTFIYLDLLIQAAGFDPEIIVARKFRKTSAKIGYTEETLDEHNG